MLARATPTGSNRVAVHARYPTASVTWAPREKVFLRTIRRCLPLDLTYVTWSPMIEQYRHTGEQARSIAWMHGPQVRAVGEQPWPGAVKAQ